MQPNRNYAAFIALAALAMAAACSAPHTPAGRFHASTQPGGPIMEIGPDGTVQIYSGIGGDILMLHRGALEVAGHTMTILSETWCQGAEGIYRWSYDGNTIRLEAVQDCDDRVQALTAAPWTPLLEE